MIGDCRGVLKEIPDESVHCCVTSPPYYGLRDYGTATWEGGNPDCKHYVAGDGEPGQTKAGLKQQSNKGSMRVAKDVCPRCGAKRIDKQIRLEQTPEEYVNDLVEVFREVKRVLRNDGVLWLNLGDSYCGGKGKSSQAWSTSHQDRETLEKSQHQICGKGETRPTDGKHTVIKPKDLIGIPWRVAFALQADGWYLRQDIIWCLSGGAWVYVKSQKGVMPMMIKDLYRLKKESIQLWNGKMWTNLLGMSKSKRRGDEIELVLRSGERISCTQTHKFPTSSGLIEASEIKIGDVLETCKLPDNENPLDCAIGELAGWFAGLYIAEGSMAGDTIQIAGHVKEEARWNKIKEFVKMYGGHVTRTVDGNKMNVRVYGKIPNAIIQEFVSGRTAIDKCFSTVCWQYSNKFLDSMLQGYLDGDGHNDVKNNRWRLGFTRNYNLERDLRTVCARLGYKLTLNPSNVKYKGGTKPIFKGEIRKERSNHLNEKQCGEVVEIRNARCRYVYDIGVEDEPHLFSLASGVLTHNSKNNPMPESVTDRCTKSHEYIFLFSKSAKYYFDNEAIKEDSVTSDPRRPYTSNGAKQLDNRKIWHSGEKRSSGDFTKRNKRSVWQVNTKPYKGAHFATFPPALVKPCILAGCPENGVVLDPFCGSGTVGQVCNALNRNAILIELNPEYKPLILDRINSKNKNKVKKKNNSLTEKVTLQQNLIQYCN